MRYLADKQAEGNDRNRYTDGTEDVQQEVGMVGIQPCAYEGQGWDEQEVQQVDVQGVGSCVLQCFPQGTFLAEPVLIIAEEHYHYQQQCVHGCGAGQVRPGKLQGV